MAEPLDDASLMQAVAAGDRAALATLYDRHAPILLALGSRIVPDRAEVEDVLHDVFLEAWRRAHRYDPRRASVRTWLAVRMRSRCLDRMKSARVARRRPLESAPEREQAPDAPAKVDGARLPAWLATLSEVQREVIVLGYFEGLSCSEMAERLAIPIGTVKSRLASALRKLRAALDTETAS